MDPLSIVATAASIAQLLDQSTKTAASARKVVQSFINAPAEVTQLVAKLDRLRLMIDRIQKVVEEGSDAKRCDDFLPTSYREILYNCLISNADALQALQSVEFLAKTKSLGVRKRVRWAAIDKSRAAEIQANIKDAVIELDVAIGILGLRLASMNQTSLTALYSTQETLLPRLESSIAEIRRHMDFQFANITAYKRDEVTTISDLTNNAGDELRANTEKLDQILDMLLVSEKRSQTLVQNFEKSQRQLVNDVISKASDYRIHDPSDLSQPKLAAGRADHAISKAKSGLIRYPGNFHAVDPSSKVDNITKLDSIVQTRLVEHSMRITRKSYSWAFGQVDQLPRTDIFKPRVGVKLTFASKRNMRKARVVLLLGLRLMYQHLFHFELNVRHSTRHWMSIPWLSCSLTTVNVRAADAPIFKACFDWDLDTIQLLLETKQASVYDVDEETRCGLLEYALRTNEINTPESLQWDPSSFKGQLALQYLLDQGCDPNAYHGLHSRNAATLTAFHYGLTDAMSSLLLHGAHFDSFGINLSSLMDTFQIEKYRTQLHFLRSIGFSDWKFKGNEHTLLHSASGAGDFPEALFALEVAKIDPNTHCGPIYLRTPLWHAAGSNQVAIASALLESGAEVNSGSMSYNGPPLCYSISFGNFDMAHWLLFHGADTGLTNRHLITPWHTIWERILTHERESLEFIEFEVLLTHLLLHNADPFQTMKLVHHEKGCGMDPCRYTPWYNHLGQIKSPEYARAWSFDSDLRISSFSPKPTIEQRLAYENAEMERIPHSRISWSQGGFVFRNKSSAPGIYAHSGTPVYEGDDKDQGDGQDEVSSEDSDSNSVRYNEYTAEDTSHLNDDEPSHIPTLFYQAISTPEGRAQMSTFPMVRLLCNALQLAGYRAEQDIEGDIWYEDDDGDIYYDAREYQSDADDPDGPTIDCYICKNPEKYGLGHILRLSEYGRQKLFEYREKVREKEKRWF